MKSATCKFWKYSNMKLSISNPSLFSPSFPSFSSFLLFHPSTHPFHPYSLYSFHIFHSFLHPFRPFSLIFFSFVHPSIFSIPLLLVLVSSLFPTFPSSTSFCLNPVFNIRVSLFKGIVNKVRDISSITLRFRNL